MDAVRQTRQERKEELLRELADSVAEQVEEGVFLETPHFCIIERAAAHLGRQWRRAGGSDRGVRPLSEMSAVFFPLSEKSGRPT